MFNQEFFPTPSHVLDLMCDGVPEGTILEPSAGKGDIVKRLQSMGREVIACEIEPDLQAITAQYCRIICPDFFSLTSEQVSHISGIVMNPPFSNADKHILHAWQIAPDGCKIIALCNYQTIANDYTNSRKELKSLLDQYGQAVDLGNPFNEAERQTNVNTAMLILTKPGENTQEFSGFFMDEDPEEAQQNGLMPYNFVRDIVNRYVQAVKIFDQQLNTAAQMEAITRGFYSSKLAFHVTEDGKQVRRNEFKKDLQKSAWAFVFEKMNLQKTATRQLREDINKFVEQQEQVPFTMRNIYKMLEIVIGTTEQRIDKAILDVFDTFTQYHADNKYNVPGWKTNSHFLLTKRFILPNGCEANYSGQVRLNYGRTRDNIEDLEKSLCYITGNNWDELTKNGQTINALEAATPGEWADKTKYREEYTDKWNTLFFFKIRGYKKGTLHVEFKDEEVWGKFNQRVSKIKGFPLFEGKEQTAYQKRQTGRPTEATKTKATTPRPTASKVLYTFNV
jgi:hypothetical protein